MHREAAHHNSSPPRSMFHVSSPREKAEDCEPTGEPVLRKHREIPANRLKTRRSMSGGTTATVEFSSPPVDTQNVPLRTKRKRRMSTVELSSVSSPGRLKSAAGLANLNDHDDEEEESVLSSSTPRGNRILAKIASTTKLRSAMIEKKPAAAAPPVPPRTAPTTRQVGKAPPSFSSLGTH